MGNKEIERLEKDSLGEVRIPAGAYWGAETQRALENFPISGFRFTGGFLRNLALIKMAAAQANMKLGLLDRQRGQAISRAAAEIREGQWLEQFPLDIFQTGSGTSTHMNINEVIAGRANELLGGGINAKKPVHANDHVNMGQSSNDVIPSAIHITAFLEIKQKLLPVLRGLQRSLAAKAQQFQDVLKSGRTHLQDATPIRLGQEFGGYASMVSKGIERLEHALPGLCELALGGTAVGTGINAHPRFARLTIARINRLSGCRFHEADDHFEAQAAREAVLETSATLRNLAVSLMKIANDIRWLGSGPRCGIGEIILPAVQPGSSIMPGKVNPVMAEALLQVATQVIGNDTAIALAGLSGNFELNVMMPLLAHNLLQSIDILSRSVELFTRKCVRGLRADRKRCWEMVEKNLSLATALSPHIGYERAAKIAWEAHARGISVWEAVSRKKIFSEDQLKVLLDPWRMLGSKKRKKFK